MVVRRTHLGAAETLNAAERGLYARRGEVGSGHGVFSSCDALRRPERGLYARCGKVGAGHGVSSSYGALRRPVSDFVVRDVVVDPGESANAAMYHKGRLLRVYDGGGLESFLDYEHRGAVERSERTLPADPKTRPDWTVLVGCTSVPKLDAAAKDLLETEAK